MQNSTEDIQVELEDLKKDAKERMEKTIVALEREFAKLRTGRASSDLVDNIKVDMYGTATPINQLSTVSIPDSRTISIQPWDRGAFGPIEKAIQKSDLGLSPVNDGKVLRIVIPPLTEDRRKDLAKVAKKYTEEAKVAIRNIRRESNDHLKKAEKDKRRMRQQVFDVEDEIADKRDAMIDSLEQRLHRSSKAENLFVVKWQLI